MFRSLISSLHHSVLISLGCFLSCAFVLCFYLEIQIPLTHWMQHVYKYAHDIWKTTDPCSPLLCTVLPHVCLTFLSFIFTLVAFFSPSAPSSAGFLIGGDVLRLLHGHMDECLTVPSGEHGDEQRR